MENNSLSDQIDWRFPYCLFPLHLLILTYSIKKQRTMQASRSAGEQSVTVNATACGFESQSRKLNINIFFLPSGIEAMRGVEFRHPTCNASRNQRKMGDVVSQHQVPSAYPATCGIQRETEKYIYICIQVYQITIMQHRNNIYRRR